ncbi:hypothetical protein [Tunicatimonas pelagia]|uniref:hypothetical protein n=1 Tax=Tunicatimonas pelagia TaxID=931531 RepID=UPI00266646EA|nr:hypothetical protein [Tunicatimonas pelagia]WKN43791.1 hypothetical protein P0M28_02250 [Tunicatimonas pelagia]
MRSILLGVGLLLFFTQCQEADLEQPVSSLVGTWQHADNTTVIRFDQNYTYTVELAPNASFQLSYRLDDPEQLVLYDSVITRTYALKFISPEHLQLTDVDVATDLNTEPSRSTFYRAK